MANKLFKFIFLLCLSVTLNSHFYLFSAFAQEAAPEFTFQLAPGYTKQYSNIVPGDKLENMVEIVLKNSVKANFKLKFSSRINYAVADTESESNLDMSNWIEYPKGFVFTIDGSAPGDQKIKIPFIINIPKSISPGDYLGSMKLVVVSDEELFDTKKEGSGLKISTALGIRFKFSVPGDRFHKLDFLEMKMSGFEQKTKETGKPRFTLKFLAQNSGNSILQSVFDVKIRNLKGEVIFENSKPVTIFAGLKGSGEVIVDSIDPFIGWIDVDTKLSYYLVDLEGKILSDIYTVGTATLRVYSIPWLTVLIVFIGLTFIIITLTYRNYSRKKLISISKTYTIKNGDNLQTICGKFSVNPGEIIKVNRLKLPYFLTAGKELLIPIKKPKIK